MAYFKLKLPQEINTYGFDYHSHFTGILPVRNKHARDKRPSMQELVAKVMFGGDEDRAALQLFGYALSFMESAGTNPFARLAVAGNKALYERAECAGENIYVACILLLGRLDAGAPHGGPWRIDTADAYRATRTTVIEPAIAAAGPIPLDLLETVRYFNGKVYSSNKYTPFDDCYKMRGAFVKHFCGGDPADYGTWGAQDPRKLRYHAWIEDTLDYLHQSGIRNTQTATTEDELDALDARFAEYNRRRDCNYKLLVHTPHHYMRDGALRDYLDRTILPLLTDDRHRQLVGLDLLGAENKVGNYRELFEFLAANSAAFASRFGQDKPRSRRLVVHVHCGEGSGFGADNRSLTGCCAYRSGPPDDAYFRRFSRYILACARAAREKRADTPRGTRGTAVPLGLFDALFLGGGTLDHDGQLLHRFDINAADEREQAAYNAKRNVMALSETLAASPRDSDRSWYETLTGGESVFALRLGHDYHYRSYMAARYPEIAFDTNVGSNAITGAAGLFASVESYRINRGFRHLDGYIDTDVLQAVGNAVAYMGTDALTQEQVARFAAISAVPGDIDTVLDDAANHEWISTQLDHALGRLRGGDDDQRLSYLIYRNLVAYVAGQAGPGPQRYQALTRVFTLFQNWRSYLLGADGQGAEHTDIQDEFLRMLVLLAYTLLPSGIRDVDESFLSTLGNFVDAIAYAYWHDTVGQPAVPSPARKALQLESIDGFKAPASVVALYRKPNALRHGE